MKTFEIYADCLSNYITIIAEEIDKTFGNAIQSILYKSINVFIIIDESLLEILKSKLNEYTEESLLEKAIKANIFV